MTKRPNFLLIITDQHRADYLGCYGHPVLKTPHIDSIASTGVRFNRFYVSNPVCMPNRATLMTGRTPSINGVRHNGIPLPLDANTFVDRLREAGYRTALVGKSHLQNFMGAPPMATPDAAPEGYDAPSPDNSEARKGLWKTGRYDQERPDSWSSPDAKLDLPFYGFDHVDFCNGHGDECGGAYALWLQEQREDADSLRGPDSTLPHDYSLRQAWRTALPEELYPTSWIADRAEDYINHHGQSDGDAPFFLMASFPDPHHPFTPPGKYWDMYKPEDMPLPASYSANDWQPPPHVKALLDARDRGEEPMDGVMSYGINADHAAQARALTCGMIAMIDDAVGKLLAALDAQGLRENTIVLFTADHGDHLGDHSMLRKGPAHYRELVRVPFLWSDPATDIAGEISEALTGTIDISATILDRAKVHPYNGLQGSSLLDVAAAPATTAHRDAVMIEEDNQRALPELGPKPRARTMITDRWRLSIYHGQNWGELYDLDADPEELHNLWDSDAHRDQRASLMEQLAQVQITLNDTSPAPLGRA
jgi:arylsulfatase A-like enzyme